MRHIAVRELNQQSAVVLAQVERGERLMRRVVRDRLSDRMPADVVSAVLIEVEPIRAARGR